jgi:hypothetical protein
MRTQKIKLRHDPYVGYGLRTVKGAAFFRNYVATLATAVKKGFGEFFALRRSTKIYVLNLNPLVASMIA